MGSSDIRALALKLGAMETITTRKQDSKQPNKQGYNFLVVLDFEATCWLTKPTRKMQNEIIEFSAVLLDVKEGEIVSTFQQYVKPTENPTLSEFCISLTGITQAIVDDAQTIENVVNAFEDWITGSKDAYEFDFTDTAFKSKKATFATWSDWDLGTCLRKECNRKKIYREKYFYHWIDVRKSYVDFYADRPMGLMGALSTLGMDFVGQEHCGLDDAKNTAYLINQMVKDGLFLQNTK